MAMTQQSDAETTTSIGGSTLAYLFADRFVLKEDPGKSGMKAFGTGEVVRTSELAGGLVAIALWQLREQGAVTMESYHAKRLGFISTKGVNIRFVQRVPAGGVEKRVLDMLEKSKKAREGRETAFDVANMICRDGGEARAALISKAIDDAVQLGYLDRVNQDVGVVGKLRGKGTKLEPRSDRIKELDAAAMELAVRWRDFRKNEEELASLLRSTAYDGVETRVRAQRDD
jgi:hypothetical protein